MLPAVGLFEEGCAGGIDGDDRCCLRGSVGRRVKGGGVDGVVGRRIIGTSESFQADEGGAADVLCVVELANQDRQERGVAELADGLRSFSTYDGIVV